MASILIIEDDRRLRTLLADYLESHGYRVLQAEGGRLGLQLARDENPDLIILDLMLPDGDGFTILRDLRLFFRQKVMMLTAQDEDSDEIIGLESGADDYVRKPIEPRVLLAKVRSALRMNVEGASQVLQMGGLCLRLVTREVTLHDRELRLTTQEYDLLLVLVKNRGTVLSREFILKNCMGMNYDGLNRSVDVTVSRLRKKLGDNPKAPRILQTIHGKGYVLTLTAFESRHEE